MDYFGTVIFDLVADLAQRFSLELLLLQNEELKFTAQILTAQSLSKQMDRGIRFI